MGSVNTEGKKDDKDDDDNNDEKKKTNTEMFGTVQIPAWARLGCLSLVREQHEYAKSKRPSIRCCIRISFYNSIRLVAISMTSKMCF